MKYTIYIFLLLWPGFVLADQWSNTDFNGQPYDNSRQAQAEREEKIIRLQERQVQLLEEQERREQDREWKEFSRDSDREHDKLMDALTSWAAEGK